MSVVAVQPAITYPGSKRRLVKHLLPLLGEHTAYVEPFAGSLAVLLAKERSTVEVVNDLNTDLVTFYRCVRFHRDALLYEMEFVLNSRVEFDEAAHQPGVTDLQRAARWFIRNRLSWGGKGETFGYSRTSAGSGAASSRQMRMERIRALSARLDRVTIECLDWRDVLRRYDAPGTVFYCDPPYTVGLQYPVQAWQEDDHRALREALGGLAGRWVLSYDDSPLVRELYGDCEVVSFDRPNGLANIYGEVGRRYREVVITPR